MEEKELDKKFGLMLSAIFTILALYLFKKNNSLSLFLPLMLISMVFIYVALFASRVLSPFTRAWLQFGMLLNKVISPMILGVIFFGVITPVAVLFRLLGRDLLRLKWNNECSTYWIERGIPGPLPQEMDNPF